MRNPRPSNFGKLAFIALFGAMVTVGAFRAIPKSGTNLLQGVLSPLPTLMLGNPLDSTADEPGDVAKFFAIEWTANGVELVLHRPPALAADALEVTLAGSTNLVTATWEPFVNVTFPAGDTNVSATVSSAMLDAHAVSNMCFFAFINSGDTDGDGLADWDERFNLKTDPGNVDSDGDGLDDAMEVDLGTNPAMADTDGDGLDDCEEIDCVCEVGVDDWHLIPGATTVFARPAAGTTIDDDIRTVVLPSPVALGGLVYDRASIDVNGKVHLIPVGGQPVVASDPDNLAPDEIGPGSGDLLVAAFWDDLEMRSTVSTHVKIGVEASTGWLVVEYLNLHVASGDDEGAVLSFQVVVVPGDTFAVRTTYRFVPTSLGAGATVENHCWQKQEVLKGMERIAGTAAGGWGFNVWREWDAQANDWREVIYSPHGAAAALADDSVLSKPVFDARGAGELMDPNATEDDVFLALAKHVPALSSPVGGNAVISLRINQNVNMNFDSEQDGIPRPNGWGRDISGFYRGNWLHSDMKDMAYFYVFKLYDQLVEKGQL